MSFSRKDVKWIFFSSESNKQEICYRKYSKPLASLSFSVFVSVVIKKRKEFYSVLYTILRCVKKILNLSWSSVSALKQYRNGALVFLVSGRSRRGRTGYCYPDCFRAEYHFQWNSVIQWFIWKLSNSQTVLNYLLAEFSLKMNEKILNGTHFCYDYPLDRETSLPVHR